MRRLMLPVLAASNVALCPFASPLTGQRLVVSPVAPGCDLETGDLSAEHKWFPFRSMIRFWLKPTVKSQYDLTRFAFLLLGTSNRPISLPLSVTGGVRNCTLAAAPVTVVPLYPAPTSYYLWHTTYWLPKTRFQLFAQAFQLRIWRSTNAIRWVRTSSALRVDWSP